jgi:hypothetical protein
MVDAVVEVVVVVVVVGGERMGLNFEGNKQTMRWP